MTVRERELALSLQFISPLKFEAIILIKVSQNASGAIVGRKFSEPENTPKAIYESLNFKKKFRYLECTNCMAGECEGDGGMGGGGPKYSIAHMMFIATVLKY